MQKYILIAFQSRGLDPDFDGPPMCELCNKRRSQDVDHIAGRREKLEDPLNLQFVCRKCHTNGWSWEQTQERLEKNKHNILQSYGGHVASKKYSQGY